MDWHHRLEELFLGLLIGLNILDFSHQLPGDLDVLKKVLSWTSVAYLFYKVSLTTILFGERNRVLDFTIVMAYLFLVAKNIIFVADKGMLTPDNLQALDEKKYQYILSESIRNALSQKTREELFLRKDTFTKYQGMEETLWYTTASDKEGKSIIVCYNQYTADKARQTRDTKLKKLETFIAETKKKHKNETGKKVIQKVRDMIIAKLITSHARKYFDAKEKETIEALFLLSRDVITREEYMDGMWIIRSSTKDLTTEELIKTYKDLTRINQYPTSLC